MWVEERTSTLTCYPPCFFSHVSIIIRYGLLALSRWTLLILFCSLQADRARLGAERSVWVEERQRIAQKQATGAMTASEASVALLRERLTLNPNGDRVGGGAKPYTINSQPSTLNPQSSTLHPAPSTLNSAHYTLHSKP